MNHKHKWLFEQCASISGSKISVKKFISTFSNTKYNNNRREIMGILEHSGCKAEGWKSSIEEVGFPAVAMSPSGEATVIAGKNKNGSFKVKTKSDTFDTFSFETGTEFIGISKNDATSSAITAFELFKTAALSQKNIFINAALASLIINIIALAASFYSMQVYDRVIPMQGLSTLFALTIGVMIAISFETVLKLIRSKIMDDAVAHIDSFCSQDIYSRVLNIRMDAFPRSVGTLSGQLQSYISIRSLITSASVYILVDIPFAILFFITVIAIGNLAMGAVVAIFFVVSFLSGVFFKNKTDSLIRKTTDASNQKTGLLVETIDKIETIKATSAEWSFLNKWNMLTKEAIANDIKIKHYTELSSHISTFLQQASYICIVAVGAYAITMSTTMTVGSLIACTILSGRMLQPVTMLPGLILQIGKAKTALEDIQKVYSLKQDNHDIDRPLDPLFHTHDLRCQNIEFKYGEKTVFEAKKLSIGHGEKVAVLGSIGSGKSVMLKILSGLMKPSNGELLVGGLQTQHIAKDAMGKVIGYMPQDTKLISGTIRDNIVLGCAFVDDKEIIEACSKSGLIHIIKTLPLGLDTNISESGNNVSGGQKQLIAITRLFVQKPKIWILDEPTSGMDDATENMVLRAIMATLKQDDILIIATHKQQVLNIASRIMVVANGAIITDGAKDEIVNRLTRK